MSSTSTVTAFDRVPVIDISRLYSDRLEDRLQVAEALGNAAREIGFLYVVGHPVAQTTIEGLRKAAKAYFAQPLETKMRDYIGASKTHKGFVPRGEEVYGKGVPDLKEAFDIGFEVPADHPLVLGGTPLLGPNEWPPLDGFREAASRYYDEVFTLGHKLFQGFALALGLDEHYFDEMAKAPPSKLRLIHYPFNADAEDAPGIGAHTDYECFTILLADNPGLEVLNAEGSWIDVPPIEGAFVVNIGDMLEVMTNGAFVATAHRVRKVSQERYSFPLFYACDYHTRIEPLPQFNDGEHRYEAMAIGEHMYAQALQTYQYLKRKVEAGELSLPQRSRKPSSFGHLKQQSMND